jgi:hypothetical protein
MLIKFSLLLHLYHGHQLRPLPFTNRNLDDNHGKCVSPSVIQALMPRSRAVTFLNGWCRPLMSAIEQSACIRCGRNVGVNAAGDL